MKKIIVPFIVIVIASFFSACHHEEHFLTDANYRSQVHDDYEARVKLAEGRAEELFSGMDSLSQSYREAMEFLYAYMPYSDLADYGFDFFYNQVHYAFLARETFPWGGTVPEDIFRHFVLVYRVNNEDLDTARMLMFHQLRQRVQGLSMEQAALEVNHWCHEHVAYRGADIRTSAPLATMRTSLGRCGEESTFAVTALRAVGIPARQCYTPRWAHCDDNHAWVEVWIASDNKGHGEWKFLGACEPDPLLNMGWFSVPSTRCMMVHSKAFGRYHGDEEVVHSTPLFSELNLLSHYAPTRRVTVTVVDKLGNLLPYATVKFKLYNYSEYYTLATMTADDSARASLTTGLGDLLIWATSDSLFGYSRLDVRKDSLLTLCVDLREGDSYIRDLDMVPPVAGAAKVTPSQEAQEANISRLAQEDSIRNAYTATFWCNRPRAEWDLAPNANLTDPQISDIISRSEGNYAQIALFLNNHTVREKGLYLYDYLCSFSDKDLRDISADVLEHHLTLYDGSFPLEVYKQGLMPARISNELVRPWRQLQPFQAPAVDDTGNYYNCPISPMGVQQLRHADPHSRDIYFVAASRAQGIPAYLDNATNIIYQWKDNNWSKIEFGQDTKTSDITATMTLTYKGKEPKVPIYYPHFTLQHFENGDFVTFDFENDPRVAKFPATLKFEPGYYCLSTGNRYPDGDVLNRLEFFKLEPGQTLTKEIVIRPLEARYIIAEGGKPAKLFIDLGDNREPSKHLSKELEQHRSEFTTITLEVVANKPKQGHDYPVVSLIDTDGNELFHSEGYKIGLLDLLLKAL